jgi:Tol biopolymer transport system component
MRYQMCFGLVVLMLGLTDALAKISQPQEIVSRPSAHCQAPQWSPDGTSLAIDVFNPKKKSREVWIIQLNDRLLPIKEERVGPLGQSTSRLNGGKNPPVVEFTWTPSMDMLSSPYIFSSQGLNRKNFDIYADGAWLTTNKGNDGQPTISPDSNLLAYTSQQKDSGDIMMIDFSGDIDKPIKLTNTPTSTEYLPRWHPQKNRLLFIRSQKTRGQDIVIIEDPMRPKASERLLTNWAADEIRPHWSPNGEWVAFYSNEKSGNDKVFDLWVIKADGSGAKRLAEDVIVDVHHGPAWTQDSSTVLYVKKDYKLSNPINWVNINSAKGGLFSSETQINSDLEIFHRASGEMMLAYRSAGLKGSQNKTWQRIYVVTFTMDDLH